MITLPAPGTILWRVLVHLHHVGIPSTRSAIARQTQLRPSQVGAALQRLDKIGAVMVVDELCTTKEHAWALTTGARHSVGLQMRRLDVQNR